MTKDLILVGNTGIMVSLDQISREWNVPLPIIRRFCLDTCALPLLLTDNMEYVSVPALETVLFHAMMPGGQGVNLTDAEAQTAKVGTCTDRGSGKPSREENDRFALYSLMYAGSNQKAVRSKILALSRRIGQFRSPLVRRTGHPKKLSDARKRGRRKLPVELKKGSQDAR